MARHCPSCRHPVDDDATACPNCPASWETEEEAHYRLRHAPRFGVSSLSSPAGLAVLSVVALVVAWRTLSFVLTWGGSESKSSPIVQFVEKRAPASLPDGPRVLGAENRAEAGPDAAPQDEEGIVTISHDQAAGPARHWSFGGRVFDLESLAPIGRCAVDFSDPQTGARFETSTDGSGRYRVELPPLEGHGYSVKIHAGGYAPSYLDPGTPNVPGMAAQERQSLAKGLQHSLDGPYTVQADSERLVTTDFYLAPAE